MDSAQKAFIASLIKKKLRRPLSYIDFDVRDLAAR